ncbi:hypothetical protein [Actinomadura sp. 3N407]|uniref:hypothetical protein n=1 Tax=Actinomadura sp. 3N407 TaxID=3457423 RepID=UPI003FCCB7B1
MTLDDEAHAVRHFNGKIRDKQRQGYIEVKDETPRPAPKPEPLEDAKLLDMRHAGLTGHEPLAGRTGVYVKHFLHRTLPQMSRWSHLVLTDDERRGLTFNVKDGGYDPDLVSAFLDFLEPHRERAFDGGSHHKVPLDAPIGPFTHALLCSPRLSRNVHDGRTAWVFPVHDCEIGDDDTETFVEARIEGRGSLPQSDWDRDPCPVTDLRFDLQSADGPFEGMGTRTTLGQRKFKTGTLGLVESLLSRLAVSTPKSRIEVRSYRGEVLTLARADLTPGTLDDVSRFVHGDRATRIE